LAGPSCPSSEMVSVASQFAPVAACYKHRPEFTDIPSEESAAELIPNEAEIDAALQEVDNGSETFESGADEPGTNSTSTAVTPSDRSTSHELNKRNRPVLVNDVRVRPEKKVITKTDEE